MILLYEFIAYVQNQQCIFILVKAMPSVYNNIVA